MQTGEGDFVPPTGQELPGAQPSAPSQGTGPPSHKPTTRAARHSTWSAGPMRASQTHLLDGFTPDRSAVLGLVAPACARRGAGSAPQQTRSTVTLSASTAHPRVSVTVSDVCAAPGSECALVSTSRLTRRRVRQDRGTALRCARAQLGVDRKRTRGDRRAHRHPSRRAGSRTSRPDRAAHTGRSSTTNRRPIRKGPADRTPASRSRQPRCSTRPSECRAT